ncbi:MAG: hypothetical protein U1U88_001128 [Lawsonella clevelandensis]
MGKAAGPRPKKKRNIIIGVLALVVVMVVVAALLWNVVGNRPSTEKEAVNPPGCPQVEVLAVPGTYESSADDDPISPAFSPERHAVERHQSAAAALQCRPGARLHRPLCGAVP